MLLFCYLTACPTAVNFIVGAASGRFAMSVWKPAEVNRQAGWPICRT